MNHRGLGDTVAAVMKATGIAAAVNAVSKTIGKPCGCCGRQQDWNRKVPYPKSWRGI